MLHLLRSELFRLRKRPQAWILGIIMVLSVATFYVAASIAATLMSDPDGPREAILPANIFENGMQIVAIVGLILTVVQGAGLIGNEYSWNTIRPLVARATSRNALLSAKWVTVAIYSTGLFVVGFLATILLSVMSTFVVGNYDGITMALVGDWLVSFGRILIGNMPYVALAFCLALLFRSIAAGIAGAIGLLFLEPLVWSLVGLLTDAFDKVHEFGLEYPSTTLFNMNIGAADTTSSEAWIAVATLVAWIVAFVAATYWAFNKRDVTSG